LKPTIKTLSKILESKTKNVLIYEDVTANICLLNSKAMNKYI